MYQKRILPYFIIPYFLTPSFFPFGALRTEGQRNFNTPRYLSSFFFPLSARGPTRRRNSTGLAELWGGWPIELEDTMGQSLVNLKPHQTNPHSNNGASYVQLFPPFSRPLSLSFLNLNHCRYHMPCAISPGQFIQAFIVLKSFSFNSP